MAETDEKIRTMSGVQEQDRNTVYEALMANLGKKSTSNKNALPNSTCFYMDNNEITHAYLHFLCFVFLMLILWYMYCPFGVNIFPCFYHF